MTAEKLAGLPADQVIVWAQNTYGSGFAIVTAFQNEGMILVDMAMRHDPKTRIVTVDTGRLPQQTYDMIDTVHQRYGVTIEVLMPSTGEVERMVARHGLNLFRADPVLRKLCCQVRKVRPLDRCLAGLEVWATGLRREQSAERAAVDRVDDRGGRLKLNPLADWTRADVDAYLGAHDVPRHPLLAEGYATIGCAPCSRAIAAGEDERAGRWWWEQDGAGKECGIHVTPDGGMRRELDVLLEEILH